MDKRKQGKRNKQKGARFESKIRSDLENKGWIISKWQNNIKDNKLVPARPGRFRLMQTGFPDFIAFKNKDSGIVYQKSYVQMQEVIAVEVKSNGYLTKEEKDKCDWYLKNNIFSKIYIASKNLKERGKIIYKEWI